MAELLIKACRTGQKGVALALLKKPDLDVNERDRQGRTALFYACAQAQRDVVIALLKRGADTTLADNHSVTPLHQAAAVGNREIMGLLLESCPAEVSDDQGVTPLMSAISYKKVEAAKFLISQGANPETKDNAGHSAADYAAANGLKASELWEASDSQKDGEGNTPLHIACISGQGDLVRTLIQKHPQWLNEINDRHETPLLLAAGTNNFMIAQLLIQAQADVNLRSNRGSTPLHLAAYRNNAPLTTLLIEAGAELDSVDQAGQSPLILAAKNGNLDCARKLIEAGADVNLCDQYQKSALDYAIQGGYTEMVERLLEAGAGA